MIINYVWREGMGTETTDEIIVVDELYDEKEAEIILQEADLLRDISLALFDMGDEYAKEEYECCKPAWLNKTWEGFKQIGELCNEDFRTIAKAVFRAHGYGCDFLNGHEVVKIYRN